MLEIPLHPLLVHLPVGLSLMLPIFALMAIVGIAKNWTTPKSWYFIIFIQVLVLLFGVIARQTGQTDSALVANYVAEEVIEMHEERAETFLLATGGMVIVAIAGAALPASWAFTGRLVYALGSCATAALSLWTASTGIDMVYKQGAARAFMGGVNDGVEEEILGPDGVPNELEDGNEPDGEIQPF